MKNIRYMLKIIHNASKSRIGISVLKQICEDVFYVFFDIYLVKYIFDSIYEGIPFSKLFLLITSIVLGQAVIHVNSALYDYYMLRNNPIIFKYIYSMIWEKAIKLPLYKYEDANFFDTYSRALEEAQARAEQVLVALARLFGQLCKLATVSVIVILWDPIIILFPIVPIITSIFINKIRGNYHYQINQEMTYDRRRASYYYKIFFDKKCNCELRVSNIPKKFLKDNSNVFERISNILKRYFIKLAWLDFFEKYITKILLMFGYYFYIVYQMKTSNKFSLGIFMSLLTAANIIIWCVEAIRNAYSELINQDKLICNIRTFMQEADEVQNSDNIPLTDKFNKLQIKDISFSFFGSNAKFIKDINLSIYNGQKIAIVGRNGAGKSTLIKLLMNLYRVTEGSILYNDLDINRYNPKEYRKKFSTVFQDFTIYAVPVANNVLMRDVNNPEDEKIVIDALNKVGLGNKIKNTKNGIFTIVTKEFDNEGENYSGGELQKITLSRVFANKDAEIIILDEPTSALDPISEYELYEQVMRYKKNKTIIFISHRLASTRMADKIFYLEDGMIIESGSHDELMNINGKYAALYKAQARNYTM